VAAATPRALRRFLDSQVLVLRAGGVADLGFFLIHFACVLTTEGEKINSKKISRKKG
jgi:hypothetical protein